jgi:uncharacterized protein
MKIEIGRKHGGAGERAMLDIPVFLRTRMLVQAASGQGKSHWLRRLCEQLFGKVQIFVVDVEGEFATLRPTFDFAVIGEGGDAPADVRSAALLAQKLLELRTSAIFDLSEAFRKHPRDRHTWVKNFLGSMMEAPKRLWHPTVVVVDEAHKFAPEKDESEASDAMIALTTDGRKRQFCPVFATQRLGKLSKDAAAELLNVMIGGTSLDIDRKRAADALGVYGKELQPFHDEIKTIERGFFWCLGPAISKERLLTYVGPTETESPKVGSSAAAEPPPPTAKIKAMLPQLADLPKLAVEKQQTEAELRREIRELKQKVRTQAPAPAQAAQTAKVGTEKVLVARKLTAEQLTAALMPGIALVNAAMAEYIQAVKAKLRKLLDAPAPPIEFDVRSAVRASLARLNQNPGAEIQRKQVAVPIAPVHALTPQQKARTEVHPPPDTNLDGNLTPYEQAMLNALADLESIGKDEPSWPLVGAAAGKSSGSSTFERYASRLRSMRFIEYPKPNRMRLTGEGRAHARGSAELLSSKEIQERALKLLTPYQADILRALIAAHPDELPIEEIGSRSGKAHGSSTFERYMAALISMEMAERRRPKTAKAADWLFID